MVKHKYKLFLRSCRITRVLWSRSHDVAYSCGLWNTISDGISFWFVVSVTHGVAVLLISRSRSIIIEYDRTFAMAFIIENGVGHVLGTQSSSGVANFPLIIELI